MMLTKLLSPRPQVTLSHRAIINAVNTLMPEDEVNELLAWWNR
jgi:hypothetical protein